MAERIDVPPTLQGDEKAQLQQVWSYLYQLSEAINNNLDGIGGNELTDSERQTMQMILSAGEKAPELSEIETLKSLIIKTADFVQTSLQEYRMNLLGETVESGKFGRYVRSTGLDVAVTPEGIMQNYSFQEIIQGLKVYEINAKNYIKTGLLRTVSSVPVYGVAIGKDVVTFSEDGTETYNDGNKVAELTADELSFWQNGVKVAGYTGSRISFYYNGTEAFYIQNGKLYSTNDIELSAGKKVIMGEWEIGNGGLTHQRDSEAIGFEIARYDDKDPLKSGVYYSQLYENGHRCGRIYVMTETLDANLQRLLGGFIFETQLNENTNKIYSFLVPLQYSQNHESSIGGENYVVTMGHFKRLNKVEMITGNSDSSEGIKIFPDDENNIFLQFKTVEESGNKTIQVTFGQELKSLEIFGGLSMRSLSEKNLNNYVWSGVFRIDVASFTNRPSDATSGTYMLEVNRYSSGYIMQRLIADSMFYSRAYYASSGSWGSWYKFTGTAV